jgi:hypothetical protein
VEFFVYLDGSSLFRAVSEDVSKIKWISWFDLIL